MAYLRIDKKEGESYIRIVASRRKHGKPLQETVYNLGKVSDYTPDQLQRFGTKFFELGGGDPRELLEGSIEELGRYNYGYYQLFSKMFRHYGLDSVFKQVVLKNKLSFDLINAVMLMLVERLHDPGSKRQNFFNQQEYLGINPVELQHLYRSLDYLAENNQHIQRAIFQTGRDIFNQALDVVFYDVTTFYFESDVEKENELRQKGFSKDGKIGSTQILFGLLIDKDKNPIGYNIYKGNTFEGHTFSDAIKRLKEEYQIKNVVVVADRGMLNKTNLEVTASEQYEFIIGERLKILPDSIKAHLLNMDNYTKQWIYSKEGDPIVVKYCTIPYQERTIVCTYSEKRSKKDAADREEKLETAKIILKNPGQLKKKAHHYFLKTDDTQTYYLNEEKIKENKKYDGFLAIATNAKDLSIEQVLDNYRHLYQIEHSFRTFKSHLETRPMFHWTDKRIEGHICLCYIAYALLNHVQQKLLKGNIRRSEKQIRKALDQMQLSLIKNKNQEFYLRSANKEDIDMLINRMGLKKLHNITPKHQLNQYFMA